MIKRGQNFKNVELYKFPKKYQKLTEFQESDDPRAFLNLSSP